MDRSELIDYLMEKGAISRYEAVSMDSYSLFVEALKYNGIIGFENDIKEWIEPFFQDYFSRNPEELNICSQWIEKRYNHLVEEGLIVPGPKSDPKPSYPDNIFTV